MERVQILINKLKQQHDENADSLQMMMTVQLLQNELMQILSANRSNLGTSKVAVTLPKTIPIPVVEEVAEISKPVATMQEKETIYAPRNGTTNNGTTKKSESANLLFDPLVEIPTLSHQQQRKEINDAAAQDEESLNDRLKQDKTELVDRLKHEPIKDLRKAIGINDRFVFINELFRGDEAMYERSIKTLNSFYNFNEAEYWINRELTLRLGWDQYSELVKHFYQLVKRRFS
jgi:hypothetical protein